jgi:hypothetical protein
MGGKGGGGGSRSGGGSGSGGKASSGGSYGGAGKSSSYGGGRDGMMKAPGIHLPPRVRVQPAGIFPGAPWSSCLSAYIQPIWRLASN